MTTLVTLCENKAKQIPNYLHILENQGFETGCRGDLLLVSVFLHVYYLLTKVNKCCFTDEGTKVQIGSVCSVCMSSFGVLACEQP